MNLMQKRSLSVLNRQYLYSLIAVEKAGGWDGNESLKECRSNKPTQQVKQASRVAPTPLRFHQAGASPNQVNSFQPS
jgi:hypothetical protein